nr:EOG090X0AQH [Lepidurus arcticus]
MADVSFSQEKDESHQLQPSMESTHISSVTSTPEEARISTTEQSSGDPFEVAFIEDSRAVKAAMDESVVFVEEVTPNLDVSFQVSLEKDTQEAFQMVDDASQAVNEFKSMLDPSSMGDSFVILHSSSPSTQKPEDDPADAETTQVAASLSSLVSQVVAQEEDTSLPDTVTLLRNSYGIPIYVVGTAHFSQASQEDVSKTIRLVQPNVIVVELCKSRMNMLHLDEETILREAKDLNIQKIRMTIKQQGAVQGALYLLLLSMSAHITRQLGMAPGGEFRRAFQEAQTLRNCMVHLGDRPIQVTLQRALASLSLWQKVKLAWHLLSSNEPISKEEVEKCKQRDMLEEMLAEMTGEFPALSQVFVKERDVFLAHSLQLAADSLARLIRPDNPARPSVVAVVGIGHVSGIVEHFGHVSQADVLQVMTIPPTSLSSRMITFAAKASVLGLVLWGCYKVLPVPRISTTWFILNMAESEVVSALEDNYSHVNESLLYAPTNVPGPGVDMHEWESGLEGCDCTGGCSVHKCACIGRFGIGSYEQGKLVDALLSGELQQPVMECHDGCSCDLTCPARLIQNGPLRGLQVFGSNNNKGYGMRTVSAISRGQFVCEYAGEVVSLEEAKRRFAIVQRNAGGPQSNYIFVLREHVGQERVLTTVIDPTVIGNIGRYINHSCGPNLVVIPVRVDSIVPHLALFAKRDILSGEELSFDYGSSWSTPESTGTLLASYDGSSVGINLTPCLCNSDNCKGILPFDSSLI